MSGTGDPSGHSNGAHAQLQQTVAPAARTDQYKLTTSNGRVSYQGRNEVLIAEAKAAEATNDKPRIEDFRKYLKDEGDPNSPKRNFQIGPPRNKSDSTDPQPPTAEFWRDDWQQPPEGIKVYRVDRGEQILAGMTVWGGDVREIKWHFQEVYANLGAYLLVRCFGTNGDRGLQGIEDQGYLWAELWWPEKSGIYKAEKGSPFPPLSVYGEGTKTLKYNTHIQLRELSIIPISNAVGIADFGISPASYDWQLAYDAVLDAEHIPRLPRTGDLASMTISKEQCARLVELLMPATEERVRKDMSPVEGQRYVKHKVDLVRRGHYYTPQVGQQHQTWGLKEPYDPAKPPKEPVDLQFQAQTSGATANLAATTLDSTAAANVDKENELLRLAAISKTQQELSLEAGEMAQHPGDQEFDLADANATKVNQAQPRPQRPRATSQRSRSPANLSRGSNVRTRTPDIGRQSRKSPSLGSKSPSRSEFNRGRSTIRYNDEYTPFKKNATPRMKNNDATDSNAASTPSDDNRVDVGHKREDRHRMRSDGGEGEGLESEEVELRQVL